jgi:hypothetical protein
MAFCSYLQVLYTLFYPKVPKFLILRANGYGYIEIPLGVSPHTLLESVWQAASSWLVGFIVGERISIVVFRWVCGFAMADLTEQRVCIKFCFKLINVCYVERSRPKRKEQMEDLLPCAIFGWGTTGLIYAFSFGYECKIFLIFEMDTP